VAEFLHESIVFCSTCSVQCRRKESSRSRSHLLMSFLLINVDQLKSKTQSGTNTYALLYTIFLIKGVKTKKQELFHTSTL